MMDNEGSEELAYSMELVQINFTKDEKIELGQEVSRLLEKLKRIERQKKSAAAEFAAREKQAALEIDDLTRKIDDGFEMRRENCIVRYDDATNMVHFVLEYDESNFIIKQRKMTPSEMQRTLPIKEVVVEPAQKPIVPNKARADHGEGEGKDGA